ncbi:MAG TPA: hypothetical protein VMT19_02540 [Thermoanaerobaculaceae bacterium]|nr:hypothetical protein [Thermoanaerobaculaceae bacterium]
MRKTLGSLVVLALCMLVAGVAVAGGITGRGAGQPVLNTAFGIDTPLANATVFGIVEVRGYVLDVRGVSRITLLIDGAPVHDADINQPRDDVRRRYRRFVGEDFPDNPGFVTSFLASNYTDGSHSLGIRVTYSDSEVEDLGTRTFTVDSTITQAPIGAIDSPRDPAVYGYQDYIAGVFPVVGWALDAGGIRQTVSPTGCNPATDSTCHVLADIEVMLDGQVVGQANYPLPRPDVANAHPDIAGAFNSGYQLALDSSKFTDGEHTISVRVWNTDGLSTVVGSRDVWFNNGYATLAPFGAIDWPMNDAHFYSAGCYSIVPPSGIEFTPGDHIDWVTGWVIDQNDQVNLEGIVSVQLLFNGVQIRDTATDCGPVNMGTGVTATANCYGLERKDIMYQYPMFGMDAKDSGYFFAFDTDYWLRSGQLHLGLNIVTIQARTKDPIRPAAVIDQIPVIVDCPTNGIFPAMGLLEHPIADEPMQGTYVVSGWVFQIPAGVKRLNFWVDGVLDGSLAYPDSHLNMIRDDVYTLYPWLPFPSARYSGFQYSLDTTKYVDGVHQLVIEAIAWNGYDNFWVQRPMIFDNLNRP